MGLLDTLQQGAGLVGDALALPHKLVWKGLSGLAGKDYGGAGDVLADMGMDKEDLLTKGLGFAGDVVTDPLTWAGALAGGAAARGAFSKMGPRYGANAAKLAALDIPAAQAERGGVSMIQHALGSPQAASVLHEIPEGSRFLGAGAESLTLKTPQGDVLRLSRFDPKSSINVPNVAEINAPTRRQIFGNIDVARTPLATQVGDEALFNQARPGLEQGLRSQGIDVFDLKPEDVGLVGGRARVLDLGSIDPLAVGGPVQPVRGPTPRGRLARGALAGAALPRAGSALLDLLGERP